MTFKEIEEKLPNGFHDARIRSIDMDFVRRCLSLRMDLLVGQPDSQNPDGYRPGTLSVRSASLFFLEPPDPTYSFVPDGSAVNVDGDAISPGQNGAVDRLLPVLPDDASVYRFFLEEWNSFLYVGGASVELSWD